jgi:predicted DNA-binding transcriptional regulator AlpA
MPMSPAPTDLLRTREAAAELRLSPRTLDRWRGTDEGPPYVRLGRKAVAYRRSDLDRWLDAQTRGNDAP